MWFVVMALLFLVGCGGAAGVASDNPPDVEGVYTCTEGCNGPTCIFDSQLTVSQSGDNVIVQSNSFGDATGSINNDGEFSAESATVSCTGQIVDDVAIANCSADGTNCQQVTFQK